MLRFLALFFALFATPVSAATGVGDADMHAVAADLRPGQFHWDQTLAAPGTSIVVSLTLQRIYIYRGGALVGVASVTWLTF